MTAASQTIASTFNSAPAPARLLLRNPFNLQLAMSVVEADGNNAALLDLKNQAGLLTTYWDRRLPEVVVRAAIEAVAARMVDTASLVVNFSDAASVVASNALVEALGRGILFQDEDGGAVPIRFRHHILFDFAVARAKFSDPMKRQRPRF